MTIQRIPDATLAGHAAAVAVEQRAIRAQHVPGSGLADGMTIEALPSWYAGIVFRSKLEADWAATLDSLGIRWQYEPQAVTLPSGARYIPDFHLPELRTWIEVKGPGVPRVEKAIEFGETRAAHGELVLIGHPPEPYKPRYDQLRAETFRSDFQRERNIARRHHGYLSWTATDGRTTWLVWCRDCKRAMWIDRGRCRTCAGPLRNTHAYNSGDRDLLFIDSAARPAPNSEVAA